MHSFSRSPQCSGLWWWRFRFQPLWCVMVCLVRYSFKHTNFQTSKFLPHAFILEEPTAGRNDEDSNNMTEHLDKEVFHVLTSHIYSVYYTYTYTVYIIHGQNQARDWGHRQAVSYICCKKTQEPFVNGWQRRRGDIHLFAAKSLRSPLWEDH